MTGRIKVFDLIKFIAIYLVVYGHIQQHLIDIDRQDNPVYTFIYSFHMPLFMIVSGYFSTSSFRMSFTDILVKKGKSLLLPVFTFSLAIAVLYYVVIYGYEVKVITFFQLFAEQMNTWLWFLKSLFVCYIVTYLLFSKQWYRYLGIIIAIVLLFVQWLNLSLMLPSFIFGVLLKKYDVLNRIKSEKWLVCCTGLFAILYHFYKYRLLEIPTIESFKVLSCYLLNQTYRFAVGISGAMTIILFAFRHLDNRSCWGG